ncbi:MAG: hypothetical protein Q9218_008327 [Villophora microphyllina]
MQDPKNYMWTRASQIIYEGAQNPHVQTAATLAAGAVAWKALDVWDTYKQADIAQLDREVESAQREKDREVESAQREKDRQVESAQREKDRQAENLRSEKDRQFEAAEREKDRQAENLRSEKALQAEAVQRQLDREHSLQVIREQVAAEAKK